MPNNPGSDFDDEITSADLPDDYDPDNPTGDGNGDNTGGTGDDTTEIDGGDDGGSDVSPTINIQIVNANKLTGMDSPNDGLSFIMVDRTSNTGYLLDYNKLAETIYGKFYSEEMAEDSMKVYFID